jgi:hypothetical protein
MATESVNSAITAVNVLTEVARYVDPVKHQNGNIQMSVSFKNLAGLLSVISTIDLDAFKKSIPGLKDYTVSTWTLSATIQYDPDVLPSNLWNEFFRIKSDPAAAQTFRQGLLAVIENHGSEN